MGSFEKPLQEFTEQELQDRIQGSNPTYAALLWYELQSRQQKENSEQISSLVHELKSLGDITNKNAEVAAKNAESDNRLARIAISIAVVSVLVQVAFSVHQNLECGVSSEADGQRTYSSCVRTVNLGIFGSFYFTVKDFTVPVE